MEMSETSVGRGRGQLTGSLPLSITIIFEEVSIIIRRSTSSVTLLSFTIILAVAITIGMWAIDVVPFNEQTFALHVVSIYIGVAGVLLFQMWRNTRK